MRKKLSVAEREARLKQFALEPNIIITEITGEKFNHGGTGRSGRQVTGETPRAEAPKRVPKPKTPVRRKAKKR